MADVGGPQPDPSPGPSPGRGGVPESRRPLQIQPGGSPFPCREGGWGVRSGDRCLPLILPTTKIAPPGQAVPNRPGYKLGRHGNDTRAARILRWLEDLFMTCSRPVRRLSTPLFEARQGAGRALRRFFCTRLCSRPSLFRARARARARDGVAQRRPDYFKANDRSPSSPGIVADARGTGGRGLDRISSWLSSWEQESGGWEGVRDTTAGRFRTGHSEPIDWLGGDGPLVGGGGRDPPLDAAGAGPPSAAARASPGVVAPEPLQSAGRQCRQLGQ
jgi:hypothetical protein